MDCFEFFTLEPTNIHNCYTYIVKHTGDNIVKHFYQFSARIVQVTGSSKAIEIFKETQRIEADGGMLVMVS